MDNGQWIMMDKDNDVERSPWKLRSNNANPKSSQSKP